MKRIAMTAVLRDVPEAIRIYEKYHADPWPEVLESGYRCGIRRAFIWRLERRLFLLLETLDEFDIDRDMDRIREHPRVPEWETIMQGLLEPSPDGLGKGAWRLMQEIHAVEDGRPNYEPKS